MAKYQNAGGAIIHVVKHKPPFSIIKTETLRDPKIGFKATGLLAYLLTLPDDWIPNVEHLSGVKDGNGRPSVESALTELQAAGYYRQYKRRDSSGKFYFVRVVFETPQLREEREQLHLFEDFMQRVAPDTEPADGDAGTLFEEQPDTASVEGPSTTRKPASGATRRNGHEGGLNGTAGAVTTTRKPASGSPPTGNREVRIKEEEEIENEKQQQQYQAVARTRGTDANAEERTPVVVADETVTALKEAGIQPPALDELIRDPDLRGLTPTIVRKMIRAMPDTVKNPAGLLVKQLREHGARIIAEGVHHPQRTRGNDNISRHRPDDADSRLYGSFTERIEYGDDPPQDRTPAEQPAPEPQPAEEDAEGAEWLRKYKEQNPVVPPLS